MTLSLISLALLNSISIPKPTPNNPYFPIHPPVCNTLDNYSCVMRQDLFGKISHKIKLKTSIFYILIELNN